MYSEHFSTQQILLTNMSIFAALNPDQVKSFRAIIRIYCRSQLKGSKSDLIQILNIGENQLRRSIAGWPRAIVTIWQRVSTNDLHRKETVDLGVKNYPFREKNIIAV
jgi:hypothetical protein